MASQRKDTYLGSGERYKWECSRCFCGQDKVDSDPEEEHNRLAFLEAIRNAQACYTLAVKHRCKYYSLGAYFAHW